MASKTENKKMSRVEQMEYLESMGEIVTFPIPDGLVCGQGCGGERAYMYHQDITALRDRRGRVFCQCGHSLNLTAECDTEAIREIELMETESYEREHFKHHLATWMDRLNECILRAAERGFSVILSTTIDQSCLHSAMVVKGRAPLGPAPSDARHRIEYTKADEVKMRSILSITRELPEAKPWNEESE